MKLQEKQKKQAGITLVALVVTIIILIILATISIRMVIGEGGLIWQANNAKVEYRAAEVDEEVLAWKAEKQMAEFSDKVQPKTRDELIDDQLERGLLTPEEAKDAKDDGKVKIGSRVIDYGEDSGVPNIPDGGDGQDSQEGAIKYSDFSWPSIGIAQVTVTKNAENDYSMSYQVYESIDADTPTRDWTPIESGNKIENLALGNVVKTAFTDGNGQYGNTADFTVTDMIEPESTASFNTTTTNIDGSVTATVTLIDNQSGIDLSKCKWVYNTSNSEMLGEESYTKEFTGDLTAKIELTLKTKTAGEYYLHILSVDKAGNKKENVYGTINVEDPRPLVNDLTDLQPGTVEARDLNGNSVVMPGKFKFAGGETDTVQQGIIIEDEDGNQFVWIPVSNIDGTNDSPDEKEIIKDDKSTVTISLARYTFDENNGTPIDKKYASNYTEEETISPYYIEKNIPGQVADESSNKSTKNATALSLKDFVDSVKTNHGYYIGRYEASYGSGTEFGAVTEEKVTPNENWYKPLVQPSTAYSIDSWTPNINAQTGTVGAVGTLWSYITQGNAALASRNMYNKDDQEYPYVESDLVNSYMWDTAIVYIQEMENSNYANAKSSNSTLKNTGETGDEKCHIFDMAGNLYEWTTEFSTRTYNGYANACVYRGDYYYPSGHGFTADRGWSCVPSTDEFLGYRPGLYVK